MTRFNISLDEAANYDNSIKEMIGGEIFVQKFHLIILLILLKHSKRTQSV